MRNRFIILMACCLPLISCTEQIEDLNFESVSPAFAAPLGKITLSTDNLDNLTDSLSLREGTDNVLEFFYELDVSNTPLSDRFSVRDQSFESTVPFTSAAFTDGEVTISSPNKYDSFTASNTDLSDPAAALTEIRFKGGVIEIAQSKNFDHRMTTSITFPELTSGGTPLTVDVINDDTRSVPLDGYILNLTGVDGDTVNTIDYALSSLIEETGSSDTGRFSVSFALKDMRFSYLGGDFRSYAFDDIQGEFDLGLPESDFPDNIGFTEPKIRLGALNSAGIPFSLDLRRIVAIQENGDSTLITGSYQNEIFLLEGAGSPGQTVESNYFISNANTDNLVEFISDIPRAVYFDGLVDANPNRTGSADNFITDSSTVEIGAELILPLAGYVNNYVISDTINDVSLSLSDDEGVSFENVDLRIMSENAFPLNVGIQLYFIETTEADGDVVLDSLFNSIEASVICPSGAVNDNGIVSTATSLISEVSIDNSKYERIKNTSKIRIVGRLLSPGASDPEPKTIKITAGNYLSLSLGISARATIDPSKL